MAARITDEQKIRINELYLQLHTYSGVAKEMGIAPSTVKKYVVSGYEAAEVVSIDEVIEPKPISEIEPITTPQEIYNATIISDEEKEEMKSLWKKLMM